MTDPDNANGFKRNPDGSISADPSSLPSTDTNDPWESWDWAQVEAAILGNSEVPTGSAFGANNLSLPQSLWDASTALYGAQQRLEMVAASIEQQAEALAGEHGPWQGDGAKAFLAQMKSLTTSVKARAIQLSGGTTGLDNVPLQLYNNGNYLMWAQESISAIDITFANAARQALGLSNSGLAPIHLLPNYVAAMTSDMRQVGQQLSSQYRITVDNVLPLSSGGLPTPKPDGSDDKPMDIPDLFPPNLFPPPDPNATPPPSPDLPPPSGPDLPAPPADSDLATSTPNPDLPTPPAFNSGLGVPPPDTKLSAPPPGVDVPPPPGSADIGGPNLANPGNDQGLNDLLAAPSPPQVPLPDPASLTSDVPPPGGPSDSVAPPSFVPPPIPDIGAPPKLSDKLGGPADEDAGDLKGIPNPALDGVGDPANLPDAQHLATPTDLPTNSAVPDPLKALGQESKPAGLPGTGGMPMMPPMGGMNGAGAQNGTERPDAAGLLTGNHTDFATQLPEHFGEPNPISETTPADQTSWAPDTTAPPTMPTEQTHTGTGNTGGMPMMPPMGGMNGAGAQNGTERPDAAGLLTGNHTDFATQLPQDFGEPNPISETTPADQTSWAPEPHTTAPPATNSEQTPTGMGGMPMMPPMGGMNGAGAQNGTERPDAAGLLTGNHTDFATQLPQDFGEPNPVHETAPAGTTSWARESAPAGEIRVAPSGEPQEVSSPAPAGEDVATRQEHGQDVASPSPAVNFGVVPWEERPPVPARPQAWPPAPAQPVTAQPVTAQPVTAQPAPALAPAAPVAWVTATSDPSAAALADYAAVAAQQAATFHPTTLSPGMPGTPGTASVAPATPRVPTADAPPSAQPGDAPGQAGVSAVTQQVPVVRASDKSSDMSSWNAGVATLLPFLVHARDSTRDEESPVDTGDDPQRRTAVAEDTEPAMAVYRRQRGPSSPITEEPVLGCGSPWSIKEEPAATHDEEDPEEDEDDEERSAAALLRLDDSAWGGASHSASDWLG